MKKSAKPFASRFALWCLLLASGGAAFADTVVIRPGDTLSIIAERELGDRSRYKEICELNLRTLRHDCNFLVVGMELTLPARGETRKVAVKAKEVAVKATAPDTSDADEWSALGGDFVARFGRFSRQTLDTSGGYQAEQKEDFSRLSGYVDDAQSDQTPGVWFKVPRFIQRRASGNTVLITVLVRAPTPGPIALAYSRDGVGNSGWITKGAGTKFRALSFTYRVPRTNSVGSDYVGILPDPRNVRQFIDVAEIAIEVLGDPHLSQTDVSPKSSTGKEWTFDSGAEGFTAVNGTLTWREDGTLRLAATGADVILRSPGGGSIPGAENTVVSARVRVNSFWGGSPAWEGRCYYGTVSHGEPGYHKEISEPSLVLNEWKVLRWDMTSLTAGDTDWVESAIRHIRIDLQHSKTAPYGIVEIDWVKVSNN